MDVPPCILSRPGSPSHSPVEMRNFGSNVVVCEYRSVPVVIVGTSHIDDSSSQLVQEVIWKLQPSAVALELCLERVALLAPPSGDHESRSSLYSAMNIWWNFGLFSALQLFASNKSRIGKEFRTAFEHAKLLPSTSVYLIDRANSITMNRVECYLTWWDTLRLFVEGISAPSEAASVNLIRSYPRLAQVLIDERDTVMSKNITGIIHNSSQSCIVVICGLGHVAGIARCLANWPLLDSNLAELEAKKPRRSNLALNILAVTGFISAFIWFKYR